MAERMQARHASFLRFMLYTLGREGCVVEIVNTSMMDVQCMTPPALLNTSSPAPSSDEDEQNEFAVHEVVMNFGSSVSSPCACVAADVCGFELLLAPSHSCGQGQLVLSFSHDSGAGAVSSSASSHDSGAGAASSSTSSQDSPWSMFRRLRMLQIVPGTDYDFFP